VNPLLEFNRFIAVLIPGLALFIVSLTIGSLFDGSNWLTERTLATLMKDYFFAVLIGGTILGLFIDGVRHLFEEKAIEEPWASQQGLDLKLIRDFATYVPTISLEHYRHLLNESYFFYEFYANLALVFFLGAVCVPIYLRYFYSLHPGPLFFWFTGLAALGGFLWYLGRDSYRYFLDTFVDTMDRISPGFKKTLELPKDGTSQSSGDVHLTKAHSSVGFRGMDMLRRGMAFVWGSVWGVIGPLVVGAAGGFLLSRYQALQKVAGALTPLVAAYLGVFTFVCILVTINQLAEMQERGLRLRKERQEPSPEEIRQYVNDALQAAGHSVALSTPSIDREWKLIVTDQNGAGYAVSLRGTPLRLIIGHKLEYIDAALAELTRIIQSPNSTLLDDLHLELARLGVQFKTDAPFSGVELVDDLPAREAMESHRFIDTFGIVQRARILTEVSIHRAITLYREVHGGNGES
jgi:hypothetical protein